METTFERVIDGAVSNGDSLMEAHVMVDELMAKEEAPYTLRKLEAKDIAPMASIINKMGWKEFKTAFQSESVKDMGDINKMGMAVAFDMVGIVLANYEKCQQDVFSFLASLSGLKAKQIESLSPAEFAEMVIAVVQKEEFKDFFTVVSKLFK